MNNFGRSRCDSSIRIGNALAAGFMLHAHIAITCHVLAAGHFLHVHLVKQRHAVQGGRTGQRQEHT
jgi:hypothetical protein